jgi:hypothetical protein
MELTPIFDALHKEFDERDDILHLPMYSEPAGTQHTLYDPEKLRTVKPAIPEYQPYKKVEATQEMEKVEPEEDETLLIQHPIIPVERVKLLVDDIDMDAAFNEAERDLGEPVETSTDNETKVLDEEFRETLSKLTPTSKVEVRKGDIKYIGTDVEEGVKAVLAIDDAHVHPINKNNVTPINRDGNYPRLPRRKNKRHGFNAKNADVETQKTNLGSSDSSSPGNAA